MFTARTRNTLSSEKSPKSVENHSYIKEILISAADDSTTHGIDHFFKREHPFIRFVWAVCFLASAAICFYLIAMSIIAYLEYETVTKAQYISELTAEFPAVSVCNLNPFLTNKSWEFVEDVLSQNGVASPTAFIKNKFNNLLLTYRFLVGMNALSANLTDEHRKSFGYDLNETLLSCSYNIGPCSVDDFEWYYDIMYGNCYKFNSGKYRNGSTAPIRKSSKAGSINGLSIELFLYKTSNPLSLSSENGAHVLVHNKSVKPAFFEGVSVASGSNVGIEIDRSFTYHLEKPIFFWLPLKI